MSRNSPATAPLPAGTAADGPGTDDSPELATLSDEQLLLRFRAAGGSAAAAERAAARAGFDELFARYRQPLWGFFRRRLDDAARAEELAQETFLVVLRGAARWEPRASFRSWLYGIALKLVAAERRRNSHRRDAPLTTVDPPAAAADLDAVLAVRAAVAALDDDHREALLLREFEGLGYDEIAAALCIPVGTVRSRLYRARTALAERLAPLHPPAPDPSRARPDDVANHPGEAAGRERQ